MNGIEEQGVDGTGVMANQNQTGKVPAPVPQPFNQMSKQGIIYIHIPRTGGSSVCNLIGQRIHHNRAIDLKREIGDYMWARSLTMATVRNPYDRMVSWWASAIRFDVDPAVVPITNKSRKPEVSFEEWVKNYGGPPGQMFWIGDEEGNLLLDITLKYEDINQWNGLPHINKTERQSWPTYYSRDTRDIVYERYRADFETLGYKR